MLIFDLNKWIGVGVGGGIFVFMLCLFFIFKKCTVFCYITIIVNALASGVAASSMFVHLGYAPPLWHSALLFVALCALFYLYCLLGNLTFFKNHYVISLLIFLLLIIASAITAACVSPLYIFKLALLALIPFIAYLVTLVIPAANYDKHLKNITGSSFAALIIVVIVVLIVLSQGEALDGISDTGGDILSAGNKKDKRNPYDYLVNLGD